MSGFWIGLGIAVAGFLVAHAIGHLGDRLFELSQEVLLWRHDRLRGDHRPSDWRR